MTNLIINKRTFHSKEDLLTIRSYLQGCIDALSEEHPRDLPSAVIEALCAYPQEIILEGAARRPKSTYKVRVYNSAVWTIKEL